MNNKKSSLVPTVLSDRAQTLTHRGKEILQDFQGKLQRRMKKAADSGITQLQQYLANPENAQRLQEHLALLAQFGFEIGFRADPNARLLFQFVEWVESHHGREQVMALVTTESLFSDSTLLHAFVEYASLLSPFKADRNPGNFTQEDLDRFKQNASHSLLRMICALAALETHEKPPYEGSNDHLRDYFESANIPDEYKPLAALIVGDTQAEVVKRRQHEENNAIAAASLLTRMTQKLAPKPSNALIRHVPGLHDPVLQFVLLSYTFFVQTYMLRHLIEGLPDFLDMLGPPDSSEAPSDTEDVIDMRLDSRGK